MRISQASVVPVVIGLRFALGLPLGLALVVALATLRVAPASASQIIRLTVADADNLRPSVSRLATSVVLARADSKWIAGSDGLGWIGFEVLESWKGGLRPGDTFDLRVSRFGSSGVRFVEGNSYLLYLHRCRGEETFGEVFRPFRAGVSGDSVEVGFGVRSRPPDPRFPDVGGGTFLAHSFLDSVRTVLERSSLESTMASSRCVVSGRVIDRTIRSHGWFLDELAVRVVRSAVFQNVGGIVLPETLEVRSRPSTGGHWGFGCVPIVEPGDHVVIGLECDSTGFHFVHPTLTVAHLLVDGTAVSVLGRFRCGAGAGADTVDRFVPASLCR